MRKQIMIAFKGLNPKFRSEIVIAKHDSPFRQHKEISEIEGHDLTEFH